MTLRDTAICKAILDYLHDLDGGQAQELVLHAGASERFFAIIPRMEFDSVLKLCAKEGWVNAVPTKFKGVLWSITPLGEKTRLEME